MPTFSALERRALADALAAAGPDGPTLCEGWTAHDLAAHLAARERRPDAGPGILLPFLAGHTERVRRHYLARPFDDVVDLVRGGPPRWSFFALPGVDAAVNLAEHFVHCEDVRRGAVDPARWQPRDLGAAFEDKIWSTLRGQSRLAFRRSRVGVVLARPSGERMWVGAGGPHVVLTGQPSELLLYCFNRTSVARVELDGPAEVLRQFREVRIGL